MATKKQKDTWMKWAMWGGAAAAAYFIFKPKTAAAASDIVLAKKAAEEQWRSRLAQTRAPRFVQENDSCYDLVSEESAPTDMCRAQEAADPFDNFFYPAE